MDKNESISRYKTTGVIGFVHIILIYTLSVNHIQKQMLVPFSVFKFTTETIDALITKLRTIGQAMQLQSYKNEGM